MLNQILRSRLALFAGGATVGGAATFFLLRSRNKSQASLQYQQQQQQQQPLPSVGRAGTDAISSPNVALDILAYGHPGPVSDFREHLGYVMSYNRQLRNPNWVAEHLTKESLKNPGNVDRGNSKFQEDTSIPEPFRALLNNYYRSGYDRGHLVPAADVKFSQKAMDETFLLTNITPQVGKGFNRDYWAHFESFIRDLPNRFDDVYCITGPLYLPKLNPADGKWYTTYEVIGNPPNVAVPTHFFKVVLAKRRNEPEIAIGGFVLPNAPINDSSDLQSFVVPIQNIEKASGLTFFNKAPGQGKVVPLCSKTKCATVLSKFHQKQLELQGKQALPTPTS